VGGRGKDLTLCVGNLKHGAGMNDRVAAGGCSDRLMQTSPRELPLGLLGHQSNCCENARQSSEFPATMRRGARVVGAAALAALAVVLVIAASLLRATPRATSDERE
jgi:hypothetical protein